MDGYRGDGQTQPKNMAPRMLSPRDIGLVHVKKDFNTVTKDVNWLNTKGVKAPCPVIVDNSNLVNSSGDTKTVKYKAENDGWYWKEYNSDCYAEINAGQKERTLVTSGVNWVTNFGASYTSKAAPNTEFTSVNHPKLVRIDTNKYIVLWEEWKAELGLPEKTYLTTKAALINLVSNNGKVDIKVALIKDLEKVRLMPGDDAFEFDGKAAWAVGDVTKGKLMFYTIDGSLNFASYELEL